MNMKDVPIRMMMVIIKKNECIENFFCVEFNFASTVVSKIKMNKVIIKNESITRKKSSVTLKK